MNVVTTTTLRNHLADTIDEVVRRDYLLVANRGNIISALVNIDLFEDLLALTDKNYLAEIKKAREEYRQGRVFSHDQVFGEV